MILHGHPHLCDVKEHAVRLHRILIPVFGRHRLCAGLRFWTVQNHRLANILWKKTIASTTFYCSVDSSGIPLSLLIRLSAAEIGTSGIFLLWNRVFFMHDFFVCCICKLLLMFYVLLFCLEFSLFVFCCCQCIYLWQYPFRAVQFTQSGVCLYSSTEVSALRIVQSFQAVQLSVLHHL